MYTLSTKSSFSISTVGMQYILIVGGGGGGGGESNGKGFGLMLLETKG